MDLYLVRHASAFERDPDRWPDDSRRPLTPEGEEEFRLIARGLARLVSRVDVVLSSPYVRAWRTAQILSEQNSWPAPEASAVLEPTLPPEKAAQDLLSYADARSIAVVGHRPGLEAFHDCRYLLIPGEAGARLVSGETVTQVVPKPRLQRLVREMEQEYSQKYSNEVHVSDAGPMPGVLPPSISPYGNNFNWTPSTIMISSAIT